MRRDGRSSRTTGRHALRHVCALPALVAACVLVPHAAHAAVGRSVSTGSSHTCAVTANGGVWCWGHNVAGQLGDGTTVSRTTGAAVSGLSSGASAVAAGGSHTCALTTGGGVKCWGYNAFGQLGDGTDVQRTTPVDVSGLTAGVQAVATGTFFSCALTTAGGVKCWGMNLLGQVGDGTTTSRATPTDVTGLTSGVAALAAGSSHACAVTTGGAAWCWGYNAWGELGDGTTIQRPAPVAVSGLSSGVRSIDGGSEHTCALTTGGGVKCWGGNTYGQLGDNTVTQRFVPVDAVGLASGVAAVSTGAYHSCVVTTNRAAKCWGDGDSGQLGDNTWTLRTSAVYVWNWVSGVAAISAGGSSSGSHSCMVTTGGAVRCWGLNEYGQVGNGTTIFQLSPADVVGLTSGVAAVALGGTHGCVATSGGAGRCWGANYAGQVGDGTVEYRAEPALVGGLATGTTVVAAGTEHSCAVTTGGAVKCWGRNGSGRLGDGTTTDRSTPVDVSGLSSGVSRVVTGAEHSCALTTAGAVKCWGENGSGQLGDGTTTDRVTPVTVSGLTSGVQSIAAGGSHTCAIVSTGGVRCWGSNASSQIGDGTSTDRLTPVDVPGLTTIVVMVTAGQAHTCAVTSSFGVRCWGANTYGQLGDDTLTTRSAPVNVSGLASGVALASAGSFHTCALVSGGVKCWGDNRSGQLGDLTQTLRRTPVDVTGFTSGAIRVAAGGGHTCLVTAAGGLKCWGNNRVGQAGIGSFGSPPLPSPSFGFGRPDFDADALADVSVYRPSTGTWFSLDSSTDNTTYRARGWGVQAQGDVAAPGDFDGDGIIDPTVYRSTYGTWFILKSTSSYTQMEFLGWGGAPTDVPVPGDYDGDGKSDVAIYRRASGMWYVRPSSGATEWSVIFGEEGDEPLAGDFDGDGRRDPAVYRPTTGTWFWLTSSSGYTQYVARGWGVQAQGDTPAPGDYDGDGKTDPCVFRPGTGTWFVLESRTGYVTWHWLGWGTTGDAVVPADFDGDGITDAAVYRSSSYTWYVRPSGGAPQWNVVFGAAGDVSLIGIR